VLRGLSFFAEPLLAVAEIVTKCVDVEVDEMVVVLELAPAPPWLTALLLVAALLTAEL